MILDSLKRYLCVESAITLFSTRHGGETPFCFLGGSEFYFRSDDDHFSSRKDLPVNCLVFGVISN